MTLDDLKRLFTRQTLFRLDAILSPKLVPILYALGLAGILLWAVSHLFLTFGYGFGTGLWGILEILVFGLLSLIGLRIACEALLVWFKTHETSGDTVNRARYSSSLIDEVRDAIRDLAEHGDEADYAEADEYITPATEPAPYVAPASTPRPAAAAAPAAPPTPAPAVAGSEAPRAPATKPGETFKPRRTAKRTPPSKP
jgi:hypothetical protein